MQGSKEEVQVPTCHQGQTHATRNEHYHKLWSEIKKRRLLDSFDLFWRIKILDGSIYLIRWEICHRSAKGAQMRYYPISVKAVLCSVHPFVYKTWKLPIVHFVIHSCHKLFLGFSSLANESPFNPDFIGRQPVVALETSYKWRLSRKNRPFPEEPSHLTHHLMQPRDKFNHSRKFALLCK